MTNEGKITKILKKKQKRWPYGPPLEEGENFSWTDHSDCVAKYCPQYFDPKSYDWQDHSRYIARYCPEHFDSKLYNWKKDAKYVAEYCPDKIDPLKFDWEKQSTTLIFYHPSHKYLKHCVWSTYTVRQLKNYITSYKTSIWKKYKNEIDDLLDSTKRKILLEKIAKNIKISKI